MAAGIAVTDHCRRRYRQRMKLPSLSDPETSRRVRLAVATGRRATARESRDLLEAEERWTGAQGGLERLLWRRARGSVSWFVLSGGLVFPCVRDVRGDGRGRVVVVISCWPVPWGDAAAEAA